MRFAICKQRSDLPKERINFMMKFVLFVFCFAACNIALSGENLDGTQSVLKKEAVSSPTFFAEGSAPVCKGPNCVKYKHKGNIAPCAVPTSVGVCMTETGCDQCCQKVTTRTPVSVEICAPACPSKHDVRTYANGSRVVHDYGKYEAVVTAKDGVAEVKYRKRLLNR